MRACPADYTRAAQKSIGGCIWPDDFWAARVVSVPTGRTFRLSLASVWGIVWGSNEGKKVPQETLWSRTEIYRIYRMVLIITTIWIIEPYIVVKYGANWVECRSKWSLGQSYNIMPLPATTDIWSRRVLVSIQYGERIHYLSTKSWRIHKHKHT